jgi:hypothetical protein
VSELCAEWAELEMQLVMAQVDAAAAVASEASTRMTLEATKQSAENAPPSLSLLPS